MQSVPLALYLFKRLREVGICTIMGLPGDFNLDFLDFLYLVDGLKWAGNANELNAAYAADGYARVKKVPGCIITTHGVGELSALNGIAGSASEGVPIIHIVGQTPRSVQEKRLKIHHSFGHQPDHQVYNKISKHVRADAAELWDIKTAPAEIDRVIRVCLLRRMPVYVYFPIDMTHEPVSASTLVAPIDLTPPVNSENEQLAIDRILDAVYQAAWPVVMVDHLSHMHGEDEARALVHKLKLPTYTTNMGQGIIEASVPYYAGVYNGNVTWPGTDRVKMSDFVLAIGWFDCDSNSCYFTRGLPDSKRIDILDDHVMVFGEMYAGVYMAPLLRKLYAAVDIARIPSVEYPGMGPNGIPSDDGVPQLTHSYLWERIGRFSRPGDVMLAETGTACFGFADATFQHPIKYIGAMYWGSIGYATPAALGAELALRELHEQDPTRPRGRTVLFTGDGSIQLTLQEVGTMIAQGLKPIIFILNNNGYTIERAIHGAKQQYNDITAYDWKHMLPLFGAKHAETQFRTVRTKKEFEALCQDERFTDSDEIQVAELILDKLDIPWRLSRMLAQRPGIGQVLREEGFSNSSISEHS